MIPCREKKALEKEVFIDIQNTYEKETPRRESKWTEFAVAFQKVLKAGFDGAQSCVAFFKPSFLDPASLLLFSEIHPYFKGRKKVFLLLPSL